MKTLRDLGRPHPGQLGLVDPAVLPLRRIMLVTTRQVGELLDHLVARGLHGFDVADVAERLLAEKLREIFPPGTLR